MVAEFESFITAQKGVNEVPDVAAITGHLTDNGVTLNLQTNIGSTLLAGKDENLLYVGWANVDIQRRVVTYTPLYTLRSEEAITEATVSLQLILDTQRSFPTNPATENLEAIIDLFTYESNTETPYGEKRIVVPYSIQKSSNLTKPKSTDGILVIGHIGIDFTESVDMAISQICTNLISGVGMIYTAAITRYIKYNYIYEALKRTSYKITDDSNALDQLNKISGHRHRCITFLPDFDVVRADYEIMQANILFDKEPIRVSEPNTYVL